MNPFRDFFLPAILSVDKADADHEIGGRRTSHKKALTMKRMLASFAALAALSFTLSSPAYTIHFNANGGEGTMADQTVVDGLPASLATNAFTNTNGFFLGWALAPDGNATLLNGDSTDDIFVEEDSEITLYAVWAGCLTDGLVAKYSFDGNLNDKSENGYTLVNHGGTWVFDRFGMEHGAIALDGQRHYLSNNDFVLNHTFSVSCWIKTSVIKDHISTGQRVWAYGSYPVYPRCEGSSSMAGIGFKAGTDGVSVVEHASNYQPVALTWTGSVSTEWNHVCVVVENDATATIYLNGERKASGALSSRSKTFSLGSIGGGGDWGNYTGSIDDLYVFDRALTDMEVYNVMLEGTAYAIRFDANGGEGAMPKRVYATGEDVMLPATTFTRTGYTFVGWAMSTDGPIICGDGETVAGGFDVENGETVTLYARWSEGSYTVHFDANGGTGTMSNQTLWLGIPGRLSTNAFSYNDLAFSGWATQPDGPVAYGNGAGVSDLCADEDSITLYAVWSVPRGLKAQYYDISSISDSSWHQQVDTYEECVAYFAAMTPTIVTNTVGLGAALDFGDNNNAGTAHFHGKYAQKGTENFVLYLNGVLECAESGLYSFNASHDDGCVVYLDGNSVYSKSAATSGWNTFYVDLSAGYHGIIVAMHEGSGGQRLQFQLKHPGETSWSHFSQSVLYDTVPYILTLDTDGGSGGSTITNIYGAAIDPSANPSREGYTFAGWNPSVPATMPPSNMTCRAQWTPIRYTVHFDANGGMGEMADLDLSHDETAMLPAVAFSRENQVFTGWAAEPDGAAVYTNTSTVSNLTSTADGEVTLYAVWADALVIFDASGGEGTMDSLPVYLGTVQTLPSCTFSKTNAFFLGWATSPNGEATLLDGDSMAELTHGAGDVVTLYAAWYEGERKGPGLSAIYYDIAAIDDSSWLSQVDTYEKCVSYYSALTPSLVTNTTDMGETLDFGFDSSCRFHGKYALVEASNFTLKLQGNFTVANSGNYSFQLRHDDGCVVYLDNEQIYSSVYKGTSWYSFSASVLEGGHELLIAFHEYDGGGQGLQFQMKGPSESSYHGLPQSFLSNENRDTYGVRFDANGGVGAMAKRVYAGGDDVALPATTFTRTGYTFVGWAMSTDGPIICGDGETVTGGFNVANGETITLYARWSTGTYTVHFDANGGMGAMPDQTLWLDVPQPLATNAFVREGFAFAGWAAAPDGQPVCEDGGDFNHTGETGDAVTLYAEWVLVPGLAVRYYDISTSGYAAWTQSESAMMDYFSAQTPTIETNTLAFGDSLDAGFTTLPDSSQQSKWRSSGLTIPQAGSRFHGKYSIESTKGFSALIEGFLRIDVPGLYEFASVADDVVVFYIDGQLILENEETWVTAATGHTRLSTGLHSITIAFREQDQAGGQGISVQWRRSGESTYTPIPQSSLWHAPRGDESTDAAILWGAVDISSALGSPDPGGRFNAPWGATVELSMSEPLVIDPDDSGVRQACVGWVGTGSVPATGSETNMSFVLRECSTVTWLWETNSVWISLAVEGDAEADGETEGWFALGTDAVLSFAPTSAVAVVCELSGDTEGVTVDAAARTVTIPADRARSVAVHVRAMTPADSLETGEAGDWSGVGGGIEAAGGWHIAPDATAADDYSLRSDEITAGETATVELAVPLAGTLTFDWRVLTTARRHYARFYVDGVRQKQITGETDWATETIALGDGAHVLRWTYEKSNAATSGEDAAFLDNVHWTPLTLAAALDATKVVWSTEGGVEWIPQVSVSSDGASAARSGALVGEETRRLVATVRGEGTFAWFWKAEIDGIAGVDVYLDGEWQEDIWLDSDVVDWEEMSLDIVGAGTHEVVFAFWNGGGVDDIGDCAYIDSVSWSGQEERTLLVENEYGTALPAVGTHFLLDGNMVTVSVAAPEPTNGIRRICTGWTGTGSIPETGTETNVTFTIQQDSSIEWTWRTDYWTEITVSGGTCGFAPQWVAAGTQIEVAIAPTSHLYEITVSGDTAGATLDGTTLRFAADRPRTIHVNVEDTTPANLEVPDLSGPGGLSFGTDGSGNPTFNVRVANPVPGVYYTAFVADTLAGPFLADAASRLAEPSDATITFALAAGDDRPSRFVRIVASTAPFAAGDPLPEGAGR